MAIHRLKYRRDVLLADTLAEYLAEAWRAYQLPDGWLVPVPLSAERQRERGYNQAGLLAKSLAEQTGQPLLAPALERARHTPSQVSLPAAQRMANLQGAFRADSKRVTGRCIVVVDDVCTTGATLTACAEALQLAGAQEVWGLTLARAWRPAKSPTSIAVSNSPGSWTAPGHAGRRSRQPKAQDSDRR
jgi:ComF family protein